MAGSAMGNWGEQKFNIAKRPGMTKVTTTYIAKIAKAIGEITGDPQLSAIGAGLGSRLPREAPGGDVSQPAMASPEEMPPPEAPVEGEFPPPPQPPVS